MLKFMIALSSVLLFQNFASAQMQITEENSESMISYYATEFARIVNLVQLERDISYPIGGTPVSDACLSLMNKDQILGKVGESVFKELTKNTDSYTTLMEGGSLKKYCRKYPTMNNNQRALVWVLVLTTMAHFESSCSDKAKAKGPNGTAYGYFQLHKGKENMYVSNKRSCAKNSSGNAVLASRCTLDMLDKQMERSSGELFYSKSYWEVLRPQGPADKAKHIARAVSNSSLCNPMTL